MAALLTASAIAIAWCAVSVWLGPRIGLVDSPERNDLTAHEHPAVPLGGVGIYLAVHVAALSQGDLDPGLFLASTLMLIMGLLDDWRGLGPVVRLSVQGLAGVLLIVSHESLAASGPWFYLFGVLLVVVAANAVNLYDGLDGLVALSAAVTGLGLALVVAGRGLPAMSPLQLVAALGGFLVFNWSPARVFLGNNGAYLVGLLLAGEILRTSVPSVGDALFLTATLGVFLIDLAASVIRRYLAGGPLLAGDRDHLYDQLRRRGLSVPVVALVSAMVQALLVLAVVAQDRLLSGVAQLAVTAALFLAVIALLAKTGFLTPQSG